MKVLGIDPGYERLGIAVVEKVKNDKETLLYSACFKTSADIPFEERLLALGNEIKKVIRKYNPEALSIENLFLSTNQKTAMRVSEVRGAILYIAMSNGLSVKEFTPLQIKLAITGNGRSDKNSMIKMIPLLINIPRPSTKLGVKKITLDDEFDAIAAALTYFAYYKNLS